MSGKQAKKIRKVAKKTMKGAGMEFGKMMKKELNELPCRKRAYLAVKLLLGRI